VKGSIRTQFTVTLRGSYSEGSLDEALKQIEQAIDDELGHIDAAHCRTTPVSCVTRSRPFYRPEVIS